MQIGSLSFEHLGSLAWYIVMTAAGVWIAVATPQALPFIDKGYADKSRNNPTAAAKQVKIFRIFGVFFALAGAALFAIEFLGLDK
jgi:hypothetical protein